MQTKHKKLKEAKDQPIQKELDRIKKHPRIAKKEYSAWESNMKDKLDKWSKK